MATAERHKTRALSDLDLFRDLAAAGLPRELLDRVSELVADAIILRVAAEVKLGKASSAAEPESSR